MNGGVPAVSQGGALAGIDQLGLPTLVAAAGERAATRFIEFFASTIRNPHTRRAYARSSSSSPPSVICSTGWS